MSAPASTCVWCGALAIRDRAGEIMDFAVEIARGGAGQHVCETVDGERAS